MISDTYIELLFGLEKRIRLLEKIIDDNNLNIPMPIKVCSICDREDKIMFMNECSHVFCENCVDELYNTKICKICHN